MPKCCTASSSDSARRTPTPRWPATSRSSICAARTSRCRPANSSSPGNPLTLRAVHRQRRARRELWRRGHAALAARSIPLLARPARRAARDALHRLSIRRSQSRWPRAGARAAVPIRPRAWNIAVRAAASRASISPGSTISISTISHDERAPSRLLTHLKAGVSGKHWRAEVWVRNLFDRYYSQRGF